MRADGTAHWSGRAQFALMWASLAGSVAIIVYFMGVNGIW